MIAVSSSLRCQESYDGRSSSVGSEDDSADAALLEPSVGPADAALLESSVGPADAALLEPSAGPADPDSTSADRGPTAASLSEG